MLNILFFLLGIIIGIMFYKIKFKYNLHNVKNKYKQLIYIVTEAIYDRKISKLEYDIIREKIIDVDIDFDKFI